MSDIIPSFFSKSDFWAMLLPGYVTVILGMLLFFPSLFPGIGISGKVNSQNIPFEVFSVVVFIIAGPSLGFILWQIYFHLSSIAFFFIRDRFNRKYEFERVYGKLKTRCNEIERAQLEALDSRHIFGMSTAIGLYVIGLHALLVVFGLSYFNHQSICMNPLIEKQSIIMCKDVSRSSIISIIIIVVGLILFLGAYFHNKRVRLPLICELMQNYNLEFTLTCRLRMNALEYHQKKKAFELISELLNKKYSQQYNKTSGLVSRHELEKQLENHLVDSDRFDTAAALEIIDALLTEKILDLDKRKIYCNRVKKEKGKMREQ